MPGRKERGQLELFITGSLRDLIPDEHVLVRIDRFLILGGFAPRCRASVVRTMLAPVSIPRLLCA